MKENQHFIGRVQKNTFLTLLSTFMARQCLDELMIMIKLQIYLYVYRMEQKPDQCKLVSQWN